MNACTHLAKTALLSTALFSCGALAADSPTRMILFVDCAHPTLPSQREVSELLGLQNFSQVYARRVSVIGEIRRACSRSEADSLKLVIDLPGHKHTHGRLVADNSNGKQ